MKEKDKTNTDFLREYKELIDSSYPGYFKGEPRFHYSMMKEFLDRGGKRLRPILCILSCEVFGGSIREALPTALALEVLHNFTLVHDDIEDQSTLRRGIPTVHIQHGVPLAINYGDGLHALSYRLLRENKEILGMNKAWDIFEKFNQMNLSLVEGQAMDLKFKKEKSMTMEVFIELLRKKTASFFAVSAQCGAIIGGARNKDVERIGQAWENLGIAFQIIDDVLNIKGNEKKIGKPTGKEIAEGNPTILIIKCLEKCTGAEKKLINKTLVSDYDTREVRDRVAEIIELFKKYDCLDYAEQTAKRYLELGMNLFKFLPANQGRERMENLASFLIAREK